VLNKLKIKVLQKDKKMATPSQSKTKIDYMARKVPTNPKYKDVKPATDTGASISKHVAKINEIKTNFKYRKDELFKRMKISTLVQLMVQVTEFNLDFPPEETQKTSEEMEEVRSTMQSVISGCGETSMRPRAAGLPSGSEGLETERRRQQNLQPQRLEIPYLLLDVREAEEFDKCHMKTATNYPSSRLARVMNFETPELHAFKNKEGRIIVLYDEEEKLAPRVAQTFVERGYDNLFLLSGGMKVASQIFPVGLFNGQTPKNLVNNNSNNPKSSTNGSSQFEDGDHSSDPQDPLLTARDLNALKMALEETMSPTPVVKTGRLATAASVGAAQRAMIESKNSARQEKLVGGQWR